MDGVIVVNKEPNYTSRDVVNMLSKKFKTKKVGHTGTLDPLASGVLVLCFGKYTKFVELLMDNYKEYIAEIVLGIETDTLDITGKVISEDNKIISKEEVIKALASFKGKYVTTVPIYSAVKVNGKKLYEYARNNQEVVIPKKETEIKELELLDINNIDNHTIIKIRCLVSKGTYIRSLSRDIGNYLNTKGTMKSLIRTKQGRFDLDMAYSINDILDDKYELLSIDDIFEYPKIIVPFELEKKVVNGVKLDNLYEDEIVMFIDNEHKPLCLYKKDGDIFRYFKKL